MESKDPFFASVHDDDAMDLEEPLSLITLKRSRAEMDSAEDNPFDFEGILEEMKGEIISHMSPLSRQMFGFTNKTYYTKSKTYIKNTHSLFDLCAREGFFDLFMEIEEEFSCPFNGTPDILLEAIEHNHVSFVSGFLSNKSYITNALRTNSSYLNRVFDVIGRYGSWSIVKILLDIIVPDNGISVTKVVGDGPVYDGDVGNALTRTIYSACLYSNIEILKSAKMYCGNGVSGRTEVARRTLLLTSLCSCKKETVLFVSLLFDLPLSMADRRFVVIPEDAPLIDVEFLRFMKDLRCSPSASAVVCNALRYKDEELLNFSIREVGCRLRDLERALVSFDTPSHEPFFDKVFNLSDHYLADPKPLARLKGGITEAGMNYFMKKGLLHPLHLKRASSKTPPELLFKLADKGFPLQFLALLNCVVRHDDVPNLARLLENPEMLRGVALIDLVIRYDSYKVIPVLIDRGYITVDEMVQHAVSTLTSTAPVNPRTLNNAGGLRQLYVGLRYALYRTQYPLMDSDGINIAPPPFAADAALSLLSKVKLDPSPYKIYKIEQIYKMLLPLSNPSEEIKAEYVKSASENEQPTHLVEIIKNV